MAFVFNKLPYDKKKFPNALEFQFRNYVTIILGYPEWKAFVSTDKKIFWVEVYLDINITDGKIEFPKDVSYDSMDRSSRKAKNLNENDFSPSADELKLRTTKEKKFFQTIPPEIKELCKKFSSSHWEIIKAITVLGEHFIKLINSNPSMAYLIVNLDKIEPKYGLHNQYRLFNRTILRKQKEILRMAGFPSSESMRIIFKKVDPKFLTAEKLILFRSLLKTSPFKQLVKQSLEKVKSINEEIFDFILLYEGGLLSIISNNAILIYKVLESEQKPEIINKIRQYYEYSIKVNGEIKPISKVTNIGTLISKLDLEIQKLSQGKNLVFPAPPLNDNQYIQALCNPKAQIAWSKKQKNCVSGYVDNVKNKKSYFYKIRLNNEEATLEIKISRKGIYMGDLLGESNRKVSKELKVMVKDWYQNQLKMTKISTLD